MDTRPASYRSRWTNRSSLQARTEICNMQHAHYRNGHLFVIRDKTSGDSEMAFIKIALTEQIEDIRRRSLRLDEIRGLGARIYRAQGIPEALIQALMTHSNKRTTQIYLERGAQALTDSDYVAVTAPLTLREMLGQKG
jgi:integrase